MQFQSSIQYDDMQSKANPTVHILVNGRPAKMMLDTGSNSHSLWDEFLLDENPSATIERQHAIVGSGNARKVKATLADYHGNAIRQDFYLLTESALSEDGYSGILSPQAIAGPNAVVVDFEENCFFTSPPFDIGTVNDLNIRRGTTIPNPYYVIATSVELDNRMIPMLVDSGAPFTFIQASLLASKPKGKESPKIMDIFKAELPRNEHMRLVDLKINGQILKSLPVIPRHTKNEEVVDNLGYIGMDILKNNIIYYDGTHHDFNLLSRQGTAQRLHNENEIRAD
ncbi:hypothetical protein [Bordetella genomosp. 10]|uniref:hypothetical protein n=1 Tax=Bordetella genomosp. 10 TaxID=1416804 RepID=UPI001178269A|nr:hypothetical protein [Bordetella genomosp. 10]